MECKIRNIVWETLPDVKRSGVTGQNRKGFMQD